MKPEFFLCVRDAKRKEKQNITQRHFENLKNILHLCHELLVVVVDRALRSRNLQTQKQINQLSKASCKDWRI